MSNFRTGGFLNKNGVNISYKENEEGYSMRYNCKSKIDIGFEVIDRITGRIKWLLKNEPCTIRGKKYPCETIEFEMI